MSENDPKKDPKEGNPTDNPKDNPTKDPKNVIVQVDTSRIDKALQEVREKLEKLEKTKEKEGDSKGLQKEYEDLMGQLKKIEEERTKERQKLETALKKAIEEKTATEEQLADLRSKLELIAEKEYAAKKQALMERVKKVIKDEDQLKAIEEELEDPENIKKTMKWVEILEKELSTGKEAVVKELTEKAKEFGINFDEEAIKTNPQALKMLEDQIAEKEEELRKKEQASKTGRAEGAGAAGAVGLTGPQKTGAKERGYETYGAMIRDLRRRERAGDEEAKKILDEFFLRWKKSVMTEGAHNVVIPEEEQEEITPPKIFYKDPRKKRE